jgi:hypothetical protein
MKKVQEHAGPDADNCEEHAADANAADRGGLGGGDHAHMYTALQSIPWQIYNRMVYAHDILGNSFASSDIVIMCIQATWICTTDSWQWSDAYLTCCRFLGCMPLLLHENVQGIIWYDSCMSGYWLREDLQTILPITWPIRRRVTAKFSYKLLKVSNKASAAQQQEVRQCCA